MQGVDNKTYIVRAGDKLSDGTVRSITADAMVILQQVNDPLSLEKEREVRKAPTDGRGESGEVWANHASNLPIFDAARAVRRIGARRHGSASASGRRGATVRR